MLSSRHSLECYWEPLFFFLSFFYFYFGDEQFILDNRVSVSYTAWCYGNDFCHHGLNNKEEWEESLTTLLQMFQRTEKVLVIHHARLLHEDKEQKTPRREVYREF